MRRPARYGSTMRSKMARMPRYHQKSFSHLAMLANSAGFMEPLIVWLPLPHGRGSVSRGSVSGVSAHGALAWSGSRLRLRFGAEAFVDSSGGTLGGHFLGAAVGLAGELFADADFHGEDLGMLGAALAYDGVARLRQALALGQLLEGALEIGDGRLDVGAGFFVARQRRIEDAIADET